MLKKSPFGLSTKMSKVNFARRHPGYRTWPFSEARLSEQLLQEFDKASQDVQREKDNLMLVAFEYRNSTAYTGRKETKKK